MPEKELICVGCPLGCHVILLVNDKGATERITGNECKEGKEYIVAEYLAPVRIFTATINAEGGRHLLPVRTDKPVHRSLMKEFMQALATMNLSPPMKRGEVIIYNFLGSGANLVATADL